MGGLDARFLVANNLRGVAPRIGSITAIGTPHFGSPVATLLNQGNPLDILPPLLGLRGEVIDDLRNNLNAVHELSESAANDFNHNCPDNVNVRYFEVVGTGRDGTFHTSSFFAQRFCS
jgi:triacylglycerol esterase/lipase EstA (alpha/beta hydrolase family)